ncbi:IS3 family transposase, partial [Nocardia asiatica]
SARSIACCVPRHNHPSQRFDNYRSVNAVIESFWGRMQTELLNRQRWKTRIELANAIFDYLEIFHNRRRRHSALGMRTPIEYEMMQPSIQPVA